MGEIKKKNTKECMAKLKIQQTFLTKSCKASLTSLKYSDPSYLNEVSAMHAALEHEREKGYESLHRKISDIFICIKNFEEEVCNEEKLLGFNAENCRANLLDIQKKITSATENVDRENQMLLEEEKRLMVEILSTQRRLEDGERSEVRPTGPMVGSKVRKNSKKQQNQRDQNIENFEAFIEVSGHNGGWEETDHLVFLQVCRKHRGTMCLVQAIKAQLPDFSVTKIKEHQVWYQEYTTLKEKQKEAINKWKQSKAQKKIESVQKLPTKINSLNTTEHVQKKEEIALWKRQRQQRLEAIEQDMKARQIAEELRQKLDEEKQAEHRAAVRQMRLLKMNERQEVMAEREERKREEQREKAAQATKLIKAFRKQDEVFIERQRTLRLNKVTTGEEGLPKVQGAVTAERDPARLLQHTKVWQSHCRRLPLDFRKPILHLRNMPHLAVPSWRKGFV